jgi:uncharacterized protein involved in exopolysaccharide biosynthesis
MKVRHTLSTGFVLILAGVVLAMAGLFLLLQPDQFRAAATINVDQSLHDTSNRQDYDPYFILTEFETIKSHAVLGQVATAFDLHDVWGKKYNDGQKLDDAAVEAMLKRHLELRPVRNTRLVEIAVIDEDPAEAAALANSIAQMYRLFKDEQMRDLLAHGVSSLKQQLQETEEKARIAKGETEKLKADLEISDLTLGSNDSAATPYFEAKRKFDNLRQTAALIETRLAEENSADSAPRPPTVEIVSLATVPICPFRPSRSMAVVIIVCGLLLITGGVFCFKNAKT